MILSLHKKLSMPKKIEYTQNKFWVSRWTRYKCGKKQSPTSIRENQTPWTIHEKKSWLSDFFYGYFIKIQFFVTFFIFQKNSFVLLSRLLANRCWMYKNDKRNQCLWSIHEKFQTPWTVQYFLDISGP